MKMYAIIFKNWFGYAAVITLLCGIIYIVGQQGFRASADDPQYQIAEDAARAISKGTDPKLLGAPAADISETLSPYLLIFDKTGNTLVNGAILKGQPLKIPQGVLDYIQLHGADHATWQPSPGVRQAMVGMRSNAGGKSYTVIAGRSLRKIEGRIALLSEQVAFGWAISMLVILVVVTLQEYAVKRWSLK
jgi:hypothetical protein